jgi:hypothetical protein
MKVGRGKGKLKLVGDRAKLLHSVEHWIFSPFPCKNEKGPPPLQISPYRKWAIRSGQAVKPNLRLEVPIQIITRLDENVKREVSVFPPQSTKQVPPGTYL